VIRKQIAELERRFETTTLKNPAEEKKILTEVKTLKSLIGNAERLLEIKPQVDKLYNDRNELRDRIKVLNE
jgi:uncharacterized coiled-coil DUF342 family protein